MKGLDEFYFEKSEPNQGCLLALREIILAQDPEITEWLRWNNPTFKYKKRMFCFLMVDKQKNEPYILIADGNLIDHPALERGNRTRMKILRIKPEEDIPVEVVTEILGEALLLAKK